MNFRHLEAFRAVMEAGTVTRAAERLGVSQPGMSKLLFQFESRLGFPAFRRHKGKLEPTPEALMLYEEVKWSFTGLEQVTRTIEGIRERKLGRVVLGSAPAFSFGLLPALLKRFTSERPDAVLALHTAPSPMIVQEVLAQHYDLGLSTINATHQNVESFRLMELGAVCALPAGHPLCVKDALALADLARQPFISVGNVSVGRPSAEQELHDAGVELDTRMEVPTSVVACPFVAAGIGLAIIDTMTARQFRGDRIALRPIEPPISRTAWLLVPRLRPLSRLALELIEGIKQEAAEYESAIP